MKVKQLISETAATLGEDDVVAALQNESGTPSSETSKKIEALVRCYRDVLQEVAVLVLPPRKIETFDGGKILFADFAFYPLKIVGVWKDGKRKKFFSSCGFLSTSSGKVDVEYEYIPAYKSINDDFEYENALVGRAAFRYGIAAAYCLETGRYSESANWESAFAAYINGLPPRRGGVIKSGGSKR